MFDIILTVLLIVYIIYNLWQISSRANRQKHLNNLKTIVIHQCECLGDVYWLGEYPRAYDCKNDVQEYIFVEEYNNRRRHIFISTGGRHVHAMPWRIIDGINDAEEAITEE